MTNAWIHQWFFVPNESICWVEQNMDGTFVFKRMPTVVSLPYYPVSSRQNVENENQLQIANGAWPQHIPQEWTEIQDAISTAAASTSFLASTSSHTHNHN